LREGDSGGGQLVKVRRADLDLAQEAKPIPTLLVGEQE